MAVRRDRRHWSAPARAVVGADPYGIWSTPLSTPERLALANAFADDPDVRRDAEALLRHLRRDLRRAFVVTFARKLLGPPALPTPAAALLPALSATIAAADDGNDAA